VLVFIKTFDGLPKAFIFVLTKKVVEPESLI
jgi:hypothetical protein